MKAALRFLDGSPLSLEDALAEKIDGSPGFYLAEDADTAAFFAARRPPGTVLRYVMSDATAKELITHGATVASVPQGDFPMPFPGREMFVPPALFARFNAVLRARRISITPYLSGRRAP